MAIRRLALRPHPETGYVTREAHIQGFMDLEAQMWFSGGVGSVVVNRLPTDVEGEMVTAFAVLEWKDRTDAKGSPEQPRQVDETQSEGPAPGQPQQRAANALEALAAEIGVDAGTIVEALAAHAAGENGDPQPVAAATEQPVAAVVPNDDGARDEPEEDVSSIPEHLR